MHAIRPIMKGILHHPVEIVDAALQDDDLSVGFNDVIE